MKHLILTLAMVSSAAFAKTTYTCETQEVDGKEKRDFTLVFNGNESVVVTDESEASDYDISLTSGNKRYKYFVDDTWDGYGGSITLRVPASLDIKETEEFNMRFEKETYSEIGHVASEHFAGHCEKK